MWFNDTTFPWGNTYVIMLGIVSKEKLMVAVTRWIVNVLSSLGSTVIINDYFLYR